MYKYEFRYGRTDENGIFPFLGEISYPHELKKGDVVILTEDMMRKLREKFPEVYSPQFWVASINYFLETDEDGVFIAPIVYVQQEEPK